MKFSMAALVVVFSLVLARNVVAQTCECELIEGAYCTTLIPIPNTAPQLCEATSVTCEKYECIAGGSLTCRANYAVAYAFTNATTSECEQREDSFPELQTPTPTPTWTPAAPPTPTWTPAAPPTPTWTPAAPPTPTPTPTPTVPPTSVGWALGGEGQSCTTTCAASSGPCDHAQSNALNALGFANMSAALAVLNRARITYDDLASTNQTSVEGLGPFITIDAVSLDAVLTFHGEQPFSSCHGYYTGVQRICCCSSNPTFECALD